MWRTTAAELRAMVFKCLAREPREYGLEPSISNRDNVETRTVNHSRPPFMETVTVKALNSVNTHVHTVRKKISLAKQWSNARLFFTTTSEMTRLASDYVGFLPFLSKETSWFLSVQRLRHDLIRSWRFILSWIRVWTHYVLLLMILRPLLLYFNQNNCPLVHKF